MIDLDPMMSYVIDRLLQDQKTHTLTMKAIIIPLNHTIQRYEGFMHHFVNITQFDPTIN